MEEWEKINLIRDELKKVLETSRKSKIIGSSLDAKVNIYCDGKEYDFIKKSIKTLKSVLIVSEVEVLSSGVGDTHIDNIKGMTVTVEHAQGAKCERCWSYSNTVGKNSENPDLCERCVEIIG